MLINGARMTRNGLEAPKEMIHVIDADLLPVSAPYDV